MKIYRWFQNLGLGNAKRIFIKAKLYFYNFPLKNPRTFNWDNLPSLSEVFDSVQSSTCPQDTCRKLFNQSLFKHLGWGALSSYHLLLRHNLTVHKEPHNMQRHTDFTGKKRKKKLSRNQNNDNFSLAALSRSLSKGKSNKPGRLHYRRHRSLNMHVNSSNLLFIQALK